MRLRFMLVSFLIIAFSALISPTYAANASVTDCTNFIGAGSIGQAVSDVNMSGGGTITFTCSGTIIFTSRLNIMTNITINANGNAVIFDETGDDNGFFVTSGAPLTLDGFTLQNGNDGFGGAISVSVSSDVTINNSTFINNAATTAGGAIRNNGTVTINNSTFTGNSSPQGGVIHNLGTLTINNSTFTGNTASTQAGVINNTVGTVTINNSIFTGNSSPLGGAIHNTNTISSQDSHYGNNTCTGTITDNGGNTATIVTGCPGTAPITLNVSALACNGDSAVFTINAGDANFSITGTGPGLPITPAAAGLYGLVGPGAWVDITITELRGDRQSLNIGGIRCPEAIVIQPTNPTPSASATVLGCALDSTDGVEVANAPDNTYCRILMKNGAVVSYSGAVPANLIGLGVQLAVDVYRLEGGASVNTFPAYAQICLSGSGRLFYMDARQSPRVAIELASEQVDSLTCGWIPAPGTLILTN